MKATAIQSSDILSLPYPEQAHWDISINERIIVEDILDYQRDLVRLGNSSPAMKLHGLDALADFTAFSFGKLTLSTGEILYRCFSIRHGPA